MQDGQQRVVIAGVKPSVDGGTYPIKRVVGEQVEVEAVVFVDGHDRLAVVLRYRPEGETVWMETPMTEVGSGLDLWRARFEVQRLGLYYYTLEAWVDYFETWRQELEKKFKAGQNLEVELLAGALLMEAAALRAGEKGAETLRTAARSLKPEMALPVEAKVALALGPQIKDLMWVHAERQHVTRFGQELPVRVEPPLARFSAWYELFPRSVAPEPDRHGTFRDVVDLLPRIAALGFDILYLPPIHPIGRQFRKGRNGSLQAGEHDPGSPWAIGSEAGGHKAVHPELGSLEDFRHLVARARELRLEIALDIALQCSPDHPYVREHPEWFRIRPDGTIQYAENPPKKYQDIYPFNFETEHWPSLWAELKSIFEFWIEQGVTVFRVDNPHTKSFAFWAWCVQELKQAHPELILLSEAFTRRPVMYHLAKIGFTQSYNYFPWRNTRRELTEYLTELTQTEIREYFRPSLWPNTPDILTQYLQYGGRPAFMARLVLAATLGASYGIYGPAYEQCAHQAREYGSEEYLNSEKYELRHWDWQAPGNLGDLLTAINRIRRDHPALQSDWGLRFHPVDNEQLLAYSKQNPAGDNLLLIVVNLDPHQIQRGWLELPLEEWGLTARETYQMHELLTDARFLWNGRRNYVELHPAFVPAHIFRLRRFVRTERDFDYFI